MTSHWPEGLARFGRFEGLRCLGAGAFGVVFEVFDEERGERVALKALHRGQGEDLFRFKQEFRSLADLRHPNLVGLHELLSDGNDWFFTMELVDGQPFLNWVWNSQSSLQPLGSDDATATLALPLRSELPPAEADPKPPAASVLALAPEGEAEAPHRLPPRLDLDRLRAALGQLAQGLNALHRAGKLHCDIKPSNILVTYEGQVRILDFGLVTELAPGGNLEGARSKLIGTPNYMAPEQAAGTPLGPPADWYGLGAVLYEALTGRVPFEGTFMKVIMDKQRKDPPPPSVFNPGIPSDLDALCMALLRREPSLRPDAEEVFLALQVEAISTGTSSHSRLHTPVLSPDQAPLGREGAMHALLDAFFRTQRGWAEAWLLRGPHGTGKGVLVRAFLEDVRRKHAHAVVLQGRCFERESVPFKAMDAILDALSQELKRRPSQEVQGLLPVEIQALARVFPVLRQIPAIMEVPSRTFEIRDSQELRRRAFGALRELLQRLSERGPLILTIEDIHWADPDSAALLAELLRAPDPPRLMLVLTLATGEEPGPIPEALEALAKSGGAPFHLQDIQDLPLSQACSLARVMLAEAGVADPTGSLASSLARESGGNPFFISLFAGECAEHGDGAIRMEGFFERRLQALGEAPLALMRVLAVAGRPLEGTLAARAAGLEEDFQEAMTSVREAQLVTLLRVKGREALEPFHQRVRQSVLLGLDETALRKTHLALAMAMEGHPGADAEALAFHYLEGGRPDRAAQHAQAAVEVARQAMAFDRAARLYRLLLKLGSSQHPHTADWRRALAQALLDAGRGGEAAQAYLEASQGRPADEALEFRRKAAEQFLLSGHIPDGLRELEGVLREVGLPMPASPQKAIPPMLLRRWARSIRGLAFQRREASQVPPLQLARIDTCWSAAAGLSMWDPVRGAYFQGRHLDMALEAGEPGRIARALSFEAGYSATAGVKAHARTEMLIRKGQALAEEVQTPYILGLNHMSTGMARFLEGRWRVAHQELRQADVILRERCRGVTWELDMAHIYDLASLWFLGELRELASRTPTLLAEARERSDRWALTNLLARVGHLPWLLQGQGEKALAVSRAALDGWPQGDFHVQALWRLMAEAETLLTLGRASDAWQWVEAEQPAIQRSMVLRIQRSRLEFRHLRARCALACAAGGQRALLPKADRALKRMTAEKAPWAEGLVLSLRASHAHLTGAPLELVLDLLRQAEGSLEHQDMALYACACRFHRGNLLGGERGRQLRESAETWLLNQGVHHPEAMVGMLVPGFPPAG